MIKEDTLIGRIAVINDLISEEQLKEATEIQKKSNNKTLAYVLLNQRYINDFQLKAILQVKKKRLPRPVKSAEERKEDMAFSYLSCKNNYLTVEEIVKALKFQLQISKKGLLFRLPEIFLHQKYLFLSEVREIQAIQERKIIACPGCQTKYNTVGLNAGSLSCSTCSQEIELSSDLCGEDEAEDLMQFRQDVEKLAQRQQKERRSFFSESTDEFLTIISESFRDSSQQMVQSRDENVAIEEMEFAGAIDDPDDISETDQSLFITLGKNPEHTQELPFANPSAQGILEEENASSLVSKSSSISTKTSTESELFEEEMVVIGGRKKDKNPSNQVDDDEDYLELDFSSLPEKRISQVTSQSAQESRSGYTSREDHLDEKLCPEDMITIGPKDRRKKEQNK